MQAVLPGPSGTAVLVVLLFALLFGCSLGAGVAQPAAETLEEVDPAAETSWASHPTAEAPDPAEVPPITIAVEPTVADPDPGEVVTYEVVVEGATEGITGYDHLDIVVEDPAVAQFVAFNETAGDDLLFSDTAIEDDDGNDVDEGPVFSMTATLGGGSLEGEEIVVAEVDVEVLGEVPSATDLSIVEDPEDDEIDEPKVSWNVDGDAYDVAALVDADLVLPGEATVDLVADETEALPGETTTYEVVVDTEFGIGSYSGIEVLVEDPGSGAFVEFTETAAGLAGDPESESEIRDAEGNPAETGPVLWLEAELGDSAFDGGEVVVAEVDAEVTGPGPSPVTLAGPLGLAEPDGVPYEVTGTDDSELTPVGLDVSVVETADPVVAGEDMAVEVEVTNVETGTVAETLELSAPDGTVVDEADIAPGGGETITETLVWETGPGDAGVGEVTVDSAVATPATAAVEVLEPANLAVASLDANTPVAGEDIEVTATVENTGDVGDTQTVTLGVDGLGDDETEVTLDGGEETEETLAVGTETGDAGEYTATVATDDDTAETGVTVLEQTGFVIASLDANVPVAGEDIEVTATVENTGDVGDTQTVVLSVDGLGDDETEVTLDGGEETEETLTVGTETGEAGEYTATVATDDDTAETELAVFEAAATLSDLDIAGQGGSATVLDGDNGSVALSVATVEDVAAEVPLTLVVETDDGEVAFEETREVAVEEDETVAAEFAGVTGGLGTGHYEVAVSATGGDLAGNLTVSVDVTGDGNPATDTTGDGLLDDVRGSGTFDVFDVQALFDGLGGSPVEDNPGLFGFAGEDDVGIADVQALFEMLTQP